jgi:O-antigen ligase
VLSAAANATAGLLDFAHLVPVQQALLGFVYLERVPGLTTHPNHLGIVTAMALPVAFAQAIGATTMRRRVVFVGMSVVLAMGLLSTGSRSALIDALVGIVALAFVLSRSHRRTLFVAAAGVAVVGVAAGLLLLATGQHIVAFNRLLGIESVGNSDVGRLVFYRQALEDFARRPLVGAGFQIVRQAHDVYLQLLQAGGILALLVFAIYFIATLRLGIQLSTRVELSREMQLLASSLTISILVLLVNGLFANQIYDRYLYVPVGLLLGIYYWHSFRHPTVSEYSVTTC